MKIGLISDLHTDVTPRNKALVPHLIDAVSAAKLDVLVLAGDLARHLVQLSETLNAFHLADLTCEKLFVPGNHDIWAIETRNVTSEQKCGIISELCYACGFHPLMDRPFVKGKVGFCGTIGWYDYSFAPDGYDFSDAQYAEKELMGAIWHAQRSYSFSLFKDGLSVGIRITDNHRYRLPTRVNGIVSDITRNTEHHSRSERYNLISQFVIAFTGEDIDKLLAVRMVVRRIALTRVNVDNTEGHLSIWINLIVTEPLNRAPRKFKSTGIVAVG